MYVHIYHTYAGDKQNNVKKLHYLFYCKVYLPYFNTDSVFVGIELYMFE